MSGADKPVVALPAAYVGLMPVLTKVARERGYALMIHGSLNRDMDLMAVPWVEEAVSAEELIEALMHVLNYNQIVDFGLKLIGPEEKPWGRRAWSITLGYGAVIDLSIMPRSA